ncbi:MAG TPA: hypothetical protein ENG40_04490 [Thermoprotei archaeon]|nr:hypothetical protein [Thermoprotei archaeon]
MITHYKLIKILSNSKEIATIKLHRGWSPRNYDLIVSMLPIKTRIYCKGREFAYFNLPNIYVEKTIPKISKGSVFALPSMKCIGIALKDISSIRYNACLLGIVTEGIDAINNLCPVSFIYIREDDNGQH